MIVALPGLFSYLFCKRKSKVIWYFPPNFDKWDGYPPAQPLSHLNAVLKQVTLNSIPKLRTEISIKEIRNRPWIKQIHDAVRLCRLRWWEWKKSGSPTDPNEETVLNMKSAKRSLRKEQRREAAKRRTEKAEEIMNARNDTRMFYKLINNQRKTMNPQLQSLVVNGKECDTPAEIRNGWGEHLQTLATPQENPRFDEEYKQMKERILCPVYKKGDPSNPGNYRGITVTPVLLKILEHILNARHNRIYLDTQSRLQKGLTSGCSSLNAAFILSECILEAASSKQDLYLTTLYTQKYGGI